MITSFLHTRFRVADLERSIAFYCSTFGLTLERRTTSSRGSKLAFLTVPGSSTSLELAEYPASGPIEVAGKDLVHVAFSVSSLAQFAEHIAAIHGSFSETPNNGIAFVDDPDGYEIELIEQ